MAPAACKLLAMVKSIYFKSSFHVSNMRIDGNASSIQNSACSTEQGLR